MYRSRATAERYEGMKFRRLHYGRIKLVPVYDREEHPYNKPENRDKWHIPGGEIRSTGELIRLANSRGISVVLVESEGPFRTSTRLN